MTDFISSSGAGKTSSPVPSAVQPQQQVAASSEERFVDTSIPEAPALKVPSADEVFAAADRVNELLKENTSSRSLRLSMDDTLNRAIFTVLDKETNEVIRVIPSDEVIAMARIIEDWIPDADEVMPQGILFDDLI